MAATVKEKDNGEEEEKEEEEEEEKEEDFKSALLPVTTVSSLQAVVSLLSI